MQNEKKQQNNINFEQPLFTGNYMRDSAVSEFERISEVARKAFVAVLKKSNKKGRS